MRKKRTAFSLIELSVVLIIAGLISSGILLGFSLVHSARLSSARSLTTKSKIEEIPTLVAWYETSMLESFKSGEAVDTSPITEWRDLNPISIPQQKNKLTKTASSAVTYKIGGINNIPSISFSSTEPLILSNFSSASSIKNTIFVVMRPTATVDATTEMTLLDSYSAGNTSSIGIIASKAKLDLGGGSGGAGISTVFNNGLNYILAIYFNNDSSTAFVNDAIITTNGIGAGSVNQLNGLTIGTNKSGTSGFTGLISEIIIYNRILSISERKAVLSYLSKKYNIKVNGV